MPSKSEKVLSAAFAKYPERSFTAEELVVACWEEYPDDFGLQGYETRFPDSNTVYRHIMGQNSIVKRQKWLLKIAQKTFQISNAGLQRSLEMLSESGIDLVGTPDHRMRLDRSREAVIARLIRGRAWEKWLAHEDPVFREACAFWGITLRSSGEEYKYAREEIDAALDLADQRLHASPEGTIFVNQTGANLGRTDLERIRDLDNHLQNLFAAELRAIRQRIVARGRLQTSP